MPSANYNYAIPIKLRSKMIQFKSHKSRQLTRLKRTINHEHIEALHTKQRYFKPVIRLPGTVMDGSPTLNIPYTTHTHTQTSMTAN